MVDGNPPAAFSVVSMVDRKTFFLVLEALYRNGFSKKKSGKWSASMW
jgi:hypothetical protein